MTLKNGLARVMTDRPMVPPPLIEPGWDVGKSGGFSLPPPQPRIERARHTTSARFMAGLHKGATSSVDHHNKRTRSGPSVWRPSHNRDSKSFFMLSLRQFRPK